MERDFPRLSDWGGCIKILVSGSLRSAERWDGVALEVKSGDLSTKNGRGVAGNRSRFFINSAIQFVGESNLNTCS